METVQEAVTERVAGDRPSRFKSTLAAAVVGFAAAALTYRLLRRSGGRGSATAAGVEPRRDS